MRKPFVVPALLLLALPLTGCNKVQARIELKEGNQYYQEEKWQAALTQYKKGLELDPEATFAWRSAGMSALAMYKPGDASPKNQEIVQEAITGFENYLADYPDDTKVRDFLMGLYIDAKRYDQALAYANRRLENEPGNVDLFNYKIRVLVAQDKLQEASQLAQSHRGENQGEILRSVGQNAWNKAFNDPTLSFETRTQYVAIGLEALEKALQVRPSDSDAMVFYGLLLREKAKLTTDATERAALMVEAGEYTKKAQDLKTKEAKEAAAAAAAPAPQPET